MRSFGLVVIALCCAYARLAAAEPEIAGQMVVTIVSDEQTKGGGAGAAVEGALPLLRNVPLLRDAFRADSAIVLRARGSVLAGLGLAWTLEAGLAARGSRGPWEPHLGMYILYMDGQLIRAIDDDGRLARGPVALQLGLDPLRFALEDGWVSFLSARCGPVLSHPGTLVSALSLSLVEVGHRFR
jgi:hypothetical protein